jgi:hypothetical protein
LTLDAHKNFASSLVATAPSPASSGTSLVVTAAAGTLFPAVPFNAVICPANTAPTAANAEVVRVTAISTDTFTITRAQESSVARTVVVGDQIFAAVTSKSFTDIETATQVGMRENLALATGQGFLCETWRQPLAVAFSTQPSSQDATFIGRLAVLKGDVVTGVCFMIGTAGSGTPPTGIYTGLYNSSGTQLAVSNDLSASAIWTSTGYAYAAFSGAYTATADSSVYALFLQNGTWSVTTHKMFTGQPSSLWNSTPTGGASAAWVKTATGQSTPPANMSGVTGATHKSYWAALY